ncbi:hypothetical protein BC833DRAFT_262660 [Globomyces pollinis-pini]|nr:hypothetical protein BC833DRAFT_262660 [Globomyces pollinis-pini]
MAELISQYVREKLNEAKKRRSLNFDNSKRMKHPLEPIATTIMDIFDNSDSELSDLSLHSSLLNSPISSTAPLEVVEGNQRIDNQNAETTILSLFDNSDLKSFQVSLQTSLLDSPISTTPLETVEGKQRIDDQKAETDNSALIFSEVLLHTSLQDSPISPVKPIEISRKSEVALNQIPVPLINPHNLMAEEDVTLEQTMNEPKEETITLKLFENSDSELSDHSLHFGLLNSPKCNLAPLEAIQRKKRLEDLKAKVLDIFDTSESELSDTSLHFGLPNSAIYPISSDGKPEMNGSKSTNLRNPPKEIPVPLFPSINPNSYHSKDSLLDADENRLASESDNFSNSERIKHQTEPTIMDVFDCSDSELSDHSLHFGFLNSSISTVATLEALDGMPRLNDTKTAISKTPDSILKEIHVPLINQNSCSSKNDADKKRPASQLDILDSSKRMKHQLGPIETAILDIFDNSDSELSDLSLHSSLLDSPISTVAPLEDVTGKQKIDEQKAQTTTLEMFDDSDSELSDHSVHFGLLDSPMSTTPLETVKGKQRIDDPKAATTMVSIFDSEFKSSEGSFQTILLYSPISPAAPAEVVEGKTRMNDSKLLNSRNAEAVPKDITVPLINAYHSNNSKLDTDKKRPASQFDILNNSKRIKHQSEAIAETTLDIDYSDSELSDHSLHFGLLNCPKFTLTSPEIVAENERLDDSMEATSVLNTANNFDSEFSDFSNHLALPNSSISSETLPALPQETPSMTMTSNSKEPKIALEDINVPLINPFFRNDNLNYSNNAALDADLALIKSLSPISTLLKYQTHVSINRSPQIPVFQLFLTVLVVPKP